MKVILLRECGYDESVLGFSLSYNTSLERTKEILPKYAFGVPGENKFLEQIIIWLDVIAPRFWWQEADTYRTGSSKQSESTMHTLGKYFVTCMDFEYEPPESIIHNLNDYIELYKEKRIPLAKLKNVLPEGFLQRRIWMISYKTLQNIYIQRYNHKLVQWKYFLDAVLEQIEHPEFIRKDTE